MTDDYVAVWTIIVRNRMTDEVNVYFEAYSTRIEAQNVAREIESEDETLLCTLRPVLTKKHQQSK